MGIEADYMRYSLLRDLGRGTAFPASVDVPGGLQTNDRFYRADLGWPCYYDGTRWLTQFEYQLTLLDFQNLGTGSPASTSPVGVRFDYAPFVTRVVTRTRVSPTNNALNYWTVAIQGANIDISAATNVYSFTTAADVASSYNRHEADALTPITPNPSNREWFRFSIASTGAPSALQLEGSIYYRLIVT